MSKTCPPKELRKPRLGVPDSYSHDDHHSEVSVGACVVWRVACILMITAGQVIMGARDRGVSESSGSGG